PHATSAWIAKTMLRAEGSDVQIVTTLHGTDITLVGQDPSYRSIIKFSIEQSDGLTAVSDWLREETYDAFDCPDVPIRVIPNFIDPDVYDRDRYPCHRDVLAPEGERIVMHISNFREVKRVSDVVRIFARVARRTPARLVMIGDGPERHRAEETAKAEGVRDQVAFLGKLESVAELLACADLLLLPSTEESFGLVALEAMATGVPVVGTSGSGLSEVVEDGVTGRLHPVGDIEAMAASGQELLGDPDVWNTYSQRGRERASELFAADRVVPRYEAYYRSVLGERDPEERRAASP
ncbi:MAG: N-acetyl-alpha-D-glucosaminyl L-malate synthase BshA, partial [Gemmatimonadota bacterium]